MAETMDCLWLPDEEDDRSSLPPSKAETQVHHGHLPSINLSGEAVASFLGPTHGTHLRAFRVWLWFLTRS